MTRSTSSALRVAGWILGIVAIVAVVWWRIGAWESPTGARDPADGSAWDGSTGLTRYPPPDRPDAPELVGTTLDGYRFDLADLVGHVVVVNVWGSWCAPCRAEAPDLARLARETADRGVRFVGIDTRDNDSAARAFVRTYDVPYPSVVDSDGQLLVGFGSLIPLSAVPSTVVIDADGRVAAKVVGRVTYSTLRGLVMHELRSAGSPASGSSGGSR